MHRGQRVAGTSRAPSVHSPRHIAHFHSVVELDASAGNGVVGDASGGALVVVACASPDSLAPDQYRRGVAAAFASRHVVNGMRRVFGVVRAAAVGSARRPSGVCGGGGGDDDARGRIRKPTEAY